MMEIVGSKDRNHQHQTMLVLMFERQTDTRNFVDRSPLAGNALREVVYCYRGVKYSLVG